MPSLSRTGNKIQSVRVPPFKTLLCAICFWLIASFSPMVEAAPGDMPAGFPQIQLPTKMRGEEAIAAVGANMRALAASYKTTEAELTGRIRKDHDLWLD